MKKLKIILSVVLLVLVASIMFGCQTADNNNQNDDNWQQLAFYPLDDGTYAVSIGNGTELSNIIIPEKYLGRNVTKIADNGFKNCNNLETIIIPNSITNIGNSAFSNCVSLSKIKIPNTVTKIEDYTFQNCTNLIEFVFYPETINISVFAFEGCKNLKYFYLGTMEQYDNAFDTNVNKYRESELYFYRETKPAEDDEYNYVSCWHYVDGEIEVWDTLMQWYRERRQATGVVKLDNGIISILNDLIQNEDLTLLVLNSSNDDIISLTGQQTYFSQPGISSTKNVVIPSISAGSESSPFYVRAKLIYTFQKYNKNRTINETIYNAEDLFMDNTGTTNILDASNGIFSNLLQFNNKWDSTGMANGYYLYIGASGTAGTPVAINDGDEPVYLFTDENVKNALGKKIDVLSINDWTANNMENQNSYVEFGGPRVYLRSGNSGNYNYTQVEIAKFDVKVVIDVITAEGLTAWKAAA